MKLTSTRLQILRNIQEGKDPYDGFTGSQLGGAVRSLQFWPHGPALIGIDTCGCLVLTPAGIQALREAP